MNGSVKNKSSLRFIVYSLPALVGTLALAWYAYMLYVPPPERQLLNSLNTALSKPETTEIALREVTPFSWDRVCLLQILDPDSHMRPDQMGRQEVEETLQMDLTGVSDAIPILERRNSFLAMAPVPVHVLVLIFATDGKAVQIYKFKNTRIAIDGEFYHVANWSSPIICLEQDRAMVRKIPRSKHISIEEEAK